MILFKKLRWKNLLSTGNIFTEIELNKTNNTLIVGENGAGKSTILDALSFALFGKPFRKINKPQLVNTITRKDLVVEVEFNIGVNQYKIIRGLKPAVFEVYQNGAMLNQSAEMRDYQEILEKQILKINHKSFCQVVVLGSATFMPFMQLPGGQRREIIEDLLDLQIFTTMNSLLKDKIADNNDSVIQANAEQKFITEKIELVKKHMLEVQNNNEKIVKQKYELIEDTSFKISELHVRYCNLDEEVTFLKGECSDKDQLEAKIKKLSNLRHAIEAKRAIISKDIEFFNDHDNCPTCKQLIDPQFKDSTVQEKMLEINSIDDGLEQLLEQYNVADRSLQEAINYQKQLNDLTMDQFKIKSNIDSLIKYRDQLEKEINSINVQQEADEDVKIAELEKELNDHEKRYNELVEEKQILSAASMLLKDGGIKARIIKQYVPVINKLINKYLSAMDFFVQFELDEEFNETIKSRFRDEFSYASFSEGEKMRINLAILFTWRAVAKLRNSVSTNLLIMDEVMDSSMDSNGTEEFLKILNNLTIDTNTFIISHKTDQLYDKFTNVIKFEKHKNFSKVA